MHELGLLAWVILIICVILMTVMLGHLAWGW